MILLSFLLLIPHVTCFTIINTWGSPGFVDANTNAKNSIDKGTMFALVEGLSTCEAEQCEGTVGYGGSPDESGETTLDAMVMDGSTLKIGAVADLREIKDAAKVAWAVMNYTQHTMLAGYGATAFAEQMGFKKENISTGASADLYAKWKANNCQPNFYQNVVPSANSSCGPYKPAFGVNWQASSRPQIDSHNHDTIGMVIINEKEVVAGTSTNGARYKIPGRVGDAPIPGAGAYALKGVGGAAATGDGDIMMRMLPSFMAVQFMQIGARPDTATTKVIAHMLKFYPNFQGAVVATDFHDRVGAACANFKSPFLYTVTQGGEQKVRHVECLKPKDLERLEKPKKKNKNKNKNKTDEGIY